MYYVYIDMSSQELQMVAMHNLVMVVISSIME